MLIDLLSVRPGVTAVIGSGGKTSLIHALAWELKEKGTVLLCTTTHIFPPKDLPCVLEPSQERIRDELRRNAVVCAAAPAERGKLTASALPIAVLSGLADYVLVEADGAHCLPLKAHASYEPVIPRETDQVIAVVGLSGLGRPIRDAAHRPELYARLVGAEPDAIVTPELAAELLNREALHDRVFLNQADSEIPKALGLRLAARLHTPVCMGALKRREAECLF